MKRLLMLVATAAVMFGASAAVSWMLTRHQLASAEPAETTAPAPAAEREHGHAPGPATAHAPGAPAPASLHPVQPPGAEETVQLAANLRARLAEVKEKEAKVDSRQKHLDLVYRDIRDERTAIETLHRQIMEEIKKAPNLPAESVPTKAMPGREDHKPIVEELLPPLRQENGIDLNNMKMAAKILSTEPPELTARLLEKLAATGKTATAVKLFADLPDKQAAEVLSNLSDPKLGDELVERAQEWKQGHPQTTK